MRRLELRIPLLAVLLAYGTAAALLDHALAAWRFVPPGVRIVSLLPARAAVLIALALVPAFVMYMNRFQIEPEERALRSRFGTEYSSYLKTVRRWI